LAAVALWIYANIRWWLAEHVIFRLIRDQPNREYYPFVWQKRLFVLGALGALAWVSMLQAPSLA